MKRECEISKIDMMKTCGAVWSFELNMVMLRQLYFTVEK